MVYNNLYTGFPPRDKNYFKGFHKRVKRLRNAGIENNSEEPIQFLSTE